MAKFPGKLMLDVDDIAAVTVYSKGHIYNLASADKLPFKMAKELGDKILVSIVEMADYLDSKLLSKGERVEASDASSTPPKRKVGRPRGTTKAALQVRCFQAELRTALYQYEVQGILGELRSESEKITLVPDDRFSCAERFEKARGEVLHLVGHAEAKLEHLAIEFATLRTESAAT
jgi:hypothetical protein